MPTTAKLLKPKSEDEFEDMCVDFLRIRWNDPHAVRNGRRGQLQHGVDIVGHPPRLNGRTAGAQCKNTDGLKLRDVVAEAKKAKSFEGGLGEFLLITSSDRDAPLQTEVRKHFKAKPAPFRVEIIFWDDIIADLAQNEALVAKHWKGFPSKASEELISDRRAKTVPWDEVRTAILCELDEIEDVAKSLLDATSRESLDGVSVDWSTPVWTAFRSEIEKRGQRWWSDVASVYANWESLKTTAPGEAVVYGGPEFAARAIAGMASCGPICQRLIPLVGRVRRLVAAESDGTQIKKAATKRAKKPRTKR